MLCHDLRNYIVILMTIDCNQSVLMAKDQEEPEEVEFNSLNDSIVFVQAYIDLDESTESEPEENLKQEKNAVCVKAEIDENNPPVQAEEYELAPNVMLAVPDPALVKMEDSSTMEQGKHIESQFIHSCFTCQYYSLRYCILFI